jgi:hypothetical protein
MVLKNIEQKKSTLIVYLNLPIASKSIQFKIDFMNLKYDGHVARRRRNSIVKKAIQTA